jgi:hypothetical protein
VHLGTGGRLDSPVMRDALVELGKEDRSRVEERATWSIHKPINYANVLDSRLSLLSASCKAIHSGDDEVDGGLVSSGSRGSPPLA